MFDETYTPSIKGKTRYCCECKRSYPCDYANSCRMVAGKPHFLPRNHNGGSDYQHNGNASQRPEHYHLSPRRTGKWSKVGNPI